MRIYNANITMTVLCIGWVTGGNGALGLGCLDDVSTPQRVDVGIVADLAEAAAASREEYEAHISGVYTGGCHSFSECAWSCLLGCLLGCRVLVHILNISRSHCRTQP